MDPMEPTVLDTTPEAADIQRRIWKRMGPEGRVRLALRMSDEMREISIAGVRARNPDMSFSEARDDVLRRMWGDELFTAWMEHRKRVERR